jgi:NDP-sugar pyrophosphorylase family protein
VILAAGKGERMHPLTEDVPKALLKVGDKVLVDWAINRLLDAGITEIVVAVGWKGSQVEDHLSSSEGVVRIVRVADYETGPLQTLVSAIETFDDHFLLIPVDTIIGSSVLAGMINYYKEQSEPRGLTLAVDSASTSGTQVSTREDGSVSGLGNGVSDTDTIGRSALLFIGNSRIAKDCKRALDAGETKLVSVLNRKVHDGQVLRSYLVESSSIDIDTLSDLLEANRLVLERGAFTQTGHVYVQPGDSIEVGNTLPLKSDITLRKGTEIIGPVLISPGCEIGERCRVGPHVTLDSNSTLLTGCHISDSIVFDESTISAQSHIQGTIVYRSKRYSAE